MDKHNLKLMIDNASIEKRAKAIGEQITKEYQGKQLKLVGILKGAVPFMCSLIKYIDNATTTLDFMSVSSYRDGTESTGTVRINKDLDSTITDDNIIIVEDIIDTGITLSSLKQLLETRGPKSIKICTLLDKPSRRKVDIKVDYIGFEVEDKFVAGFGLDYAQIYRQLPDIYEVVFDKE